MIVFFLNVPFLRTDLGESHEEFRLIPSSWNKLENKMGLRKSDKVVGKAVIDTE